LALSNGDVFFGGSVVVFVGTEVADVAFFDGGSNVSDAGRFPVVEVERPVTDWGGDLNIFGAGFANI
jgi:hypothetical protein